jgi:hypothetical protein
MFKRQRFWSTALEIAMAGLIWGSGCGARNETPSSEPEERQSALTTAGNRIVGFEAPTTDWTITQGSILPLQSSTTRTQGALSLAVRAKGFVVVKSQPFPVSGAAIASPVIFDLLLPTQQPSPSFGAAQLYIDCPSKSLVNAFVGQQDLTGLPLNQFSTLIFQLPAAMATTLAGGCTDLAFRIGLNVPSNATGTYLLDNLHFRGSLGDVRATLKCVAQRTSTNYTAYFGYINRETFVVPIPVGPDNLLLPAPPARGQPINFEVGTQPSVVRVDFQAGQTASWHLPTGTATANTASPVCAGSVPTNVPCVGVPPTTPGGCATVILLPNTAGPDPVALDRGFDPSILAQETPDPGDDGEAAIAATRTLFFNAFSLGPQGSTTISTAVTGPTMVFAKADWHKPATVTMTLQQGTKTVNGSAVNLNLRGGVNTAAAQFGAGTVLVRLQNTGTKSTTITLSLGLLP